MVPLPQIGLALAGSTLLTKYNKSNKTTRTNTITMFNPPSPKSRTGTSLPSGKNPFQGLFGKTGQLNRGNPFEPIIRGLNTTLSQIVKPAPKEDYYAVIRDFLPTGSKPLKPRYPAASKDIEFADLDGDAQNELITSYAINNEIRTIVLKKQPNGWKKISEIITPAHQGMHYRGVANITGDGRKKQLLVATLSRENIPILHGYSLDGNTAHKLFEHKSHRFQILHSSARNKNTPASSRLAFWKRNEEGAYDVELLQWRDAKLQPSTNIGPYYYRHVLPQHVQRIRQAPLDPAGWYNFAHVLKKAGLNEDARVAIEVGMNHDRKNEYKDKFLKLKGE